MNQRKLNVMPQSPEGIAWREYHTLELMLATIPATLFRMAFNSYKGTLTDETSNLRDVPPNAIIFGFHHDIFKTFSAPSLLKLKSSCHFLGYHGLLSYLSTCPYLNREYRTVRFSRRHHLSPFQQIVSKLETLQSRLFMFTDAGGPYGRVRQSLIELSIQTQRPLVGIRHVCSQEWTVGSHSIPRPGSTMQTFMSPIFQPKDLTKYSNRREACQSVQAAMDALLKPEQKPHKEPAEPFHNLRA